MDAVSEAVVGGDDAGGGPRLVLRLYVAGSAPNSARAHANLLALLERAGVRGYDLQIVDCFREPQRALRDGVLVTPTLVKLEPEPPETIIGTLSDARDVALALGLAEGPSPRAHGRGPRADSR
jgi:circadian clock protein KaiB